MRFMAGSLVVVGHSIETNLEYTGPAWLYMATWALRLPVFALVCGYFSSGGPLNAREIRRLIESVALPYLIFTTLQVMQIWLLYDKWEIALGRTRWTLWFLLSLIAWRVALPYLVALRFPFSLAVIGSLGVGYLAEFGTTFSASRTIAYLPFFILGYQVRQGLLSGVLAARWSRFVGAGAILASFAVFWFLREDMRVGWLYMRAPYNAEIDIFGLPMAWIVRAGLVGLGVVVALSFVALVPRRQIPFITYLGAGGMFIYLLHPLVLRQVRYYGWHELPHAWYEHLTMMAAAVLLAAVLASPPVRLLTKPLVQPTVPWLFSTRFGKESEKRSVPPAPVEVPAPASPVPSTGLTSAGVAAAADAAGVDTR